LPPLRQRLARLALTTGVAVPLTLVTACSAADRSAPAAQPPASPTAGPVATEAGTVTPRLVLTHDGGMTVLDATSLKPVGDLSLPGFNRINAAGDGRHVLVSTTGGFRVLDAGTWGELHGDHAHYYTAPPALTDVTHAAEKPGHVVVHAGRTALFDDGTGQVVVADADEIAAGAADARRLTTPAVHHGVAVELADGTLVVSEGTEEARTGIRVLDPEGREKSRFDQCPGVHGEAMAAGEAVVIGCEDGAVVHAKGRTTKVQSPDAYGRIGNQAGSDASPVVLGDYKTDPDAELERPTRVSLIDTRTAKLKLVDLPASYSFRSLARGEDGEALVLGTDGALRQIDPATGKIVRTTAVVKPWTEPDDWQEPRPTVTVLDGSAYVTEPASNTVHAVDVETGKVWKRAALEVTPNELTGVTGDTEAGHEEHEHAEGETEDQHEGEGADQDGSTPR